MSFFSFSLFPLSIGIVAVSLSQNVPATATASVSPASVFSGGASPSTLSALVSQHRLLELSRFGLRGYDLAQHMLTQQGAVSKLLGKIYRVYWMETIPKKQNVKKIQRTQKKKLTMTLGLPASFSCSPSLSPSLSLFEYSTTFF